jgi:hypothetical protein
MRFCLLILFGMIEFCAIMTCRVTDANALLWICEPAGSSNCRPYTNPGVPLVHGSARSACRWVLVKGAWVRRCP